MKKNGIRIMISQRQQMHGCMRTKLHIIRKVEETEENDSIKKASEVKWRVTFEAFFTYFTRFSA